MRQTLAFDNTLEHWKTRYSYVPSCMMHLNKLFFSSPQSKTQDDGKDILYRHNDSSAGRNTFYDADPNHSSPSALAVSFNGFTAKSLRSAASNTTSSNKIFKSFSISGLNEASAPETILDPSLTGLKLGASSFIVNNQNKPGSRAEGFHKLSPLRRMGNSVYGEIGKDFNMSGTEIRPIGQLSNVYKWSSFDETNNLWQNLTSEVEEIDIISELITDGDGNEIAPQLPNDDLYAFEISYFVSNNPMPSGVFGGNPGDGIKFFHGKGFAAGAANMSANPFVPLEGYTPTTADFGTNFQSSVNFAAGTNFTSYLSYGDPYQDIHNTYKKGNFIFLKVNKSDTSPHLPYESTPSQADQIAIGRIFLFAMTPGNINGADPHGSFADAFVIIGDTDFEISSLQVEFEFTEYDHGGMIGTASKARSKK